MIRVVLLLIVSFLVSCSSNNAIDAAREHQNKLNETDSRFEKLYKDLDKETK